jgi:2-polyprenyl-3-methyl-5-hydroxy-6-metoxy-1,4-benzoquinol methylase
MHYRYSDSLPTHANTYLWPELHRIISQREWSDRRAFDLGCGNGASCGMLQSLGFSVTGVDPSESGIRCARAAFPDVNLSIASAYDDLASYGTFPLVVSLEVIEHCVDHNRFLKTFLSLIAPGGIGVLSTPYHGYFKNLAIALVGKCDSHYDPLWEGGHVKFFSPATLQRALVDVGARDFTITGIGRIPVFAKSMIAVVYA